MNNFQQLSLTIAQACLFNNFSVCDYFDYEQFKEWCEGLAFLMFQKYPELETDHWQFYYDINSGAETEYYIYMPTYTYYSFKTAIDQHWLGNDFYIGDFIKDDRLPSTLLSNW